MSFKQHAYPLVVEPQRSFSLLVFYCGIHLAAFVLVLIFSLGVELKLVCTFLLALNLWWILKHGRRRIRLSWEASGEWQICCAKQSSTTAYLSKSTRWNSYFVWLHLRTDKRTFFAAIIPRDAVSADTFRRLRVRLAIDGKKSTEVPEWH